MTRKTVVGAIALIYMLVGFLNFAISLFSIVSPFGTFVIRVYPLVGGAIACYAGCSLFRLDEFGRKLVIFLLSIRVVINAMILLRLPFGFADLGIQNRFGEIIYRIQGPYTYQGILTVLIVIPLLMILFLLQKATKEICVPMATGGVEPDIILKE